MSIENSENNKKINPAEIETKKEEEISQSFANEESEENILSDVSEKLRLEDHNFYLEKIGAGVVVRRVDNNEIIYFTDEEADVEALYKAEAEGRV